MQWFADMVLARYNEIARDLGRGTPQPLFDVDERNGEVLWDLWVEGFAGASRQSASSDRITFGLRLPAATHYQGLDQTVWLVIQAECQGVTA